MRRGGSGIEMLGLHCAVSALVSVDLGQKKGYGSPWRGDPGQVGEVRKRFRLLRAEQGREHHHTGPHQILAPYPLPIHSRGAPPSDSSSLPVPWALLHSRAREGVCALRGSVATGGKVLRKRTGISNPTKHQNAGTFQKPSLRQVEGWGVWVEPAGSGG